MESICVKVIQIVVMSFCIIKGCQWLLVWIGITRMSVL